MNYKLKNVCLMRISACLFALSISIAPLSAQTTIDELIELTKWEWSGNNMINNFLKKVYTEDSWYMEDVIDGGGEITTYFAKSTTSEEEAMVYTNGDGIISLTHGSCGDNSTIYQDVITSCDLLATNVSVYDYFPGTDYPGIDWSNEFVWLKYSCPSWEGDVNITKIEGRCSGGNRLYLVNLDHYIN
tara:strand:+ start:1577 stop:2137 length:561 start_codon:yes stop_codon:yes gene_type:complete